MPLRLQTRFSRRSCGIMHIPRAGHACASFVVPDKELLHAEETRRDAGRRWRNLTSTNCKKRWKFNANPANGSVKSSSNCSSASEDEVQNVLAEQLGIEKIDLYEERVDNDVARMISADMIARHQAMPVRQEGNNVIVAMVDPLNLLAIDDIRLSTGLDVVPRITSPHALKFAYDQLFGVTAEAEKHMEEFRQEQIKKGYVIDDSLVDKATHGRDRAGADRQAGGHDPHRRRRPPRFRRARRAQGRPRRGALPHRRHAAQDPDHPAPRRLRRDRPSQDHGALRHVRAPQAAGRPYRPGDPRRDVRHPLQHRSRRCSAKRS